MDGRRAILVRPSVCGSSSAVEHRLPKPRVTGSNPACRSCETTSHFWTCRFFVSRQAVFVQSVAVWQSNLHFGRRLLRNVSSLRELLLPKINFRPSISQIRQSSIAPTSFALLKSAATGRIWSVKYSRRYICISTCRFCFAASGIRSVGGGSAYLSAYEVCSRLLRPVESLLLRKGLLLRYLSLFGEEN